MAFLAFVYDDYYCHGITASFRGRYEDIKEAHNVLRGDRYSHQNLEILNFDTMGITRYRCLPLYVHNSGKVEGVRKEFLKHRYKTDDAEFEIEWDGNVRKYNEHQCFYDAGEWEQVRD